ncbi:hypothetical protein C7271_24890 [filamentous cyanobacterium CCP5]|nr:hypothetical protein C7271_24890 [filamentous cyanobacterium CCP5]
MELRRNKMLPEDNRFGSAKKSFDSLIAAIASGLSRDRQAQPLPENQAEMGKGEYRNNQRGKDSKGNR